jgi:hypothetical protein
MGSHVKLLPWGVAALALLLGVATSEAAVPASAPATRPAGEFAGRVAELIGQLQDADPDVRYRARLLIKNLPGDALDALTAALHEDLGPEVRHTLNIAVARTKVRAAKLQKLREDMQWARRTNLSEYERAGHKDAKWDAAVKQGIEDFADLRGPRAEAYRQFDAALEAGCDDPYVLYLHARTMAELPTYDPQKLAKECRKAASDILKSDYDAARKMMVLFRCYQLPGTSEAPADEILKVAADAARQPDVPRDWLVEVFQGLMEPLTQELGREEAYNKIFPVYQSALPGSPWPLLFKGKFYTEFAWDIRGGGWASTVTPAGWKGFRERLQIADQALEEAWKMDPTISAIADEMITVCLGQGGGRGRMEIWFRRAVEANLDDYPVCAAKLYYLYPRWHGSHQEMIAFGRQCAAGENYLAGIPFILAQAHAQVAAESPDPQAYLQGDEVWADISRVFDDALLLYPTTRLRSEYAQWAVRCGRWVAADKQFRILADHPDPTIFPDKRMYDSLRQQARKAAGGEPLDGRL